MRRPQTQRDLTKKLPLNIPNILSLYRILVFPFLVWFILGEHATLFAVFLIINLLTDAIDGIIARRFGMQTEIGSRLDSIGDMTTYIAGFWGIYVFKWEEIAPHVIPFAVFAGLCVLLVVLALIKFGRLPSFHLYSWKIGGYIQGFFFIVLFSFGLYLPLYYIMVTWSILAALEHILIQMIIPRMRSNVKGLYWVLREQKTGHGGI